MIWLGLGIDLTTGAVAVVVALLLLLPRWPR